MSDLSNPLAPRPLAMRDPRPRMGNVAPLGGPAPPLAMAGSPRPQAMNTTALGAVPSSPGLPATPGQPPSPDYSQMTHEQLLSLRNSLPPDHPLHAQLGPKEHAAFAREWTAENPALAVPSLLASIPAYTAAKAVGLAGGRSPPSLAEMADSYRGMFSGLGDAVQRWRGGT